MKYDSWKPSCGRSIPAVFAFGTRGCRSVRLGITPSPDATPTPWTPQGIPSGRGGAGVDLVSRVLSGGSRSELRGPARRPFIWDDRCRPPRAAYPEVRRRGPRRGGEPPPSLFGLSPGGVYRARTVTSPAVSSYLTVSPLPVHARGRPSAVYSLLHFPWPCGRWPLATTQPCGARTFLDGRNRRDRPVHSGTSSVARFRLPSYFLDISGSRSGQPPEMVEPAPLRSSRRGRRRRTASAPPSRRRGCPRGSHPPPIPSR